MGETRSSDERSDEPPTPEELNDQDAKVRRKSLKATTVAVTLVLDNTDGLERLKAIPDEEWAEAVAQDEVS